MKNVSPSTNDTYASLASSLNSPGCATVHSVIEDPAPNDDDDDPDLPPLALDPVIFVTLPPGDRSAISSALYSLSTLSSFLSTLAFALGCYALNPSVMSRLEDAAKAQGDVGFVFDLALPVAFGVAAVQASREVAKQAAARVNGVKTGAPSFIPSLNFGVIAVATRLRSPPPDRKALYDIGVAPALVGYGVSLLLLFLGLSQGGGGGPSCPPSSSGGAPWGEA